VALPQGSLVVNSSQGGGSKDTWVLQAIQKKSSKAPALIKPHYETGVENVKQSS
jgi:uncharacterized circularly permuted ATP-grasp superfamily protein